MASPHPDDGILRTSLSEVDGEKGKLTVRGYDLEELAGRVDYEDICGLLWNGKLPSATEREAIRSALGEARVRIFRDGPRVAQTGSAMDALRGAVGQLTTADAVSLTAAIALFTVAWHQKKPVAPDPKLSHVADYLRMIRGDSDPARVEALTAYFVTVADHGMNASTYTARVIASTASDLVSSITGAIGALKGPLHGGAPGPVLDMFSAIKTPDRATAWLEAEVAAGRRIMGMGHRVYKVRDPRAAVLEGAIERLEKAGVATENLALARAVEKSAVAVLRKKHPERPIHANVEFYTAVTLDAVGIPNSLFTATFAASRIAGWCAHVAEQQATGRLIRPESIYVGPRTR